MTNLVKQMIELVCHIDGGPYSDSYVGGLERSYNFRLFKYRS